MAKLKQEQAWPLLARSAHRPSKQPVRPLPQPTSFRRKPPHRGTQHSATHATRVFVLRARGREERRSGAAVMAVGDLVFKALTAGLGVATLYLAATFSVNVYRGLSWHAEQSKLEKEKTED